MRHYLFSRFNINHLAHLPQGHPMALDSDWFNNRVKLFYKYTYPTVAYQINKNFNWIVLVDERTEGSLIEKLKELDVLKIFSILKVGEFGYLQTVKDLIKKESEHQDEIIISTTLDTDDGIFPEFIDVIQGLIRKSDLKVPYGVNLSKGFIVDTGSGIFHSKSFSSNPFFSLIEKKKDFKSVCCLPHHLLSCNYLTINYINSPLWIQNIHSNNLINRIKGRPIIFKSNLPMNINKLYKKYRLLPLGLSFSYFFKEKLLNLFLKLNLRLKV